jgi:arginine/lysine/ornithine decarboxylase
MLEKKLIKAEYKPFAVYITSPDYLGGMCDIESIAHVCKKYDIPLLVDNAHGSYLKFCQNDMHPISLGAQMCCDSAHKTLPVLTGGGYLHIAKDDKYEFSKNVVNAMAIFGSTSPSYLILQSLDLCNRYIDEKIREEIKLCAKKVTDLKHFIKSKGFKNVSFEPLKLTVDCRGTNLDLRCILSENRVEYEYYDGDFIVFMFTPQNSDNDFNKIKKVFENIEKTDKYTYENIEIPVSEKVMTICQAVFTESEEIDVENSLNRICASPTVSCPPAVPIAVSGERITKNHIELFKKYNIDKILAVKK